MPSARRLSVAEERHLGAVPSEFFLRRRRILSLTFRASFFRKGSIASGIWKLFFAMFATTPGVSVMSRSNAFVIQPSIFDALARANPSVT